METQNLVILFDYSWFLAKNIAYAEGWIMKFHYRNSSNGEPLCWIDSKVNKTESFQTKSATTTNKDLSKFATKKGIKHEKLLNKTEKSFKLHRLCNFFWSLTKRWTSSFGLLTCIFFIYLILLAIKGCLSLFSYFIDRRPTLMSPFFVKKTCFFLEKHVFSTKNGLIRVGLLSKK